MLTDLVYAAGPQAGYQWLLADDEADYERVNAIATRAPGEAWAPLPMHLLEHDDDGTSLKPGDLPWHASMTLAVSGTALRTLGPLLEPYGEFLPVSGSATGYHLFNATCWSDALDEERSELVRFSTGRIMDLRNAVLAADAFERAEVILLNQMPRGPLLFSASLVDRINALGLTGTRFTPCGSLSGRPR